MDLMMELATLDFDVEFNEVNIFEGIDTPSPTDSLNFGLELPEAELNLPDDQQLDQPLWWQEQDRPEAEPELEPEIAHAKTEANREEPEAAAPAPAEIPVEELPEAEANENEAQATGGSSDLSDHSAASSVVADTAPNLLPQLSVSSNPLLNDVHSNHGSLSVGEPSTFRALQWSRPYLSSYANQLAQPQNDNLHLFQGLGMINETSVNQTLNGINHHPSLYPHLCLQNRANAGAGLSTGFPNPRELLDSQRNDLLTRQNHHITTRHKTWDSFWPKQFTSLLPPVSRAPGMQRIFDLQYSMQPLRPIYPTPEPYSRLPPGFAAKPTNSCDRQHCYRPLLPPPPEPAVPSLPVSANYHPQPTQTGMIYNSFGAGFSMPSRYPQLYDRHNNHLQSEIMMHNPLCQQAFGSPQLSGSVRVSDHRNECNPLLSSPSVPSRSSMSHAPTNPSRFSISQTLSSGWNKAPEATSSLSLSSMAAETSGLTRPQNVQLQREAPASVSTMATKLIRGKFPECSSASRITEELLKLLNESAKQNATTSGPRADAQHHQIQHISSRNEKEIWTPDDDKELKRDGLHSESGKLREGEKTPRLCRPTKGLEVGESSSSSKRQKVGKDPAGAERAETFTHSQGDLNWENDKKEDEKANPTIRPALRKVLSSIYDPQFEGIGLPIDPHLRLFDTKREMIAALQSQVPKNLGGL